MDRQTRIRSAKTAREAFAALADCTVEECDALGYAGWLTRVIERQEMIYAILTFMQVSGLSLGTAKLFCGAVANDPEPMRTQVARALSTGDANLVARILLEHYTGQEHQPAERFATALIDAFAVPR